VIEILSISNISARFAHLKYLTPSEFLRTFINIMFGLAGVLAFINLIIGGLQWIWSGGEKEGLDKAKRRIIHSLIGLGIVYSSYALVYIIRVLYNIDLIQVVLSPIGT
jgi:hypothetical protein